MTVVTPYGILYVHRPLSTHEMARVRAEFDKLHSGAAPYTPIRVIGLDWEYMPLPVRYMVLGDLYAGVPEQSPPANV